MKLKLGIFGDSYGVNTHSAQKNISYEGWVSNKLLTDNFDITNFCAMGSDFSFSYYNFLKNYFKFDKIIFIVTNSTRQGYTIDNVRFWHKIHTSNQTMDEFFSFQINRLKDHNMYNAFNFLKIKKITDCLNFYFSNILDNKFTDAAVCKLTEEILEIKNDTILIPAFKNSFFKEDFYLSMVTNFENELIDKKGLNRRDYHNRPSHMFSKNNEIFAEYIFNKLAGIEHRQLFLDSFVEPDFSEEYFY